jgi:cytoskeletal protein RodZ
MLALAAFAGPSSVAAHGNHNYPSATPSSSTEPTQSTEPTRSVEPSQSVEPTQSTEPTPSQSTEPSQSTNPCEPTDPENKEGTEDCPVVDPHTGPECVAPQVPTEQATCTTPPGQVEAETSGPNNPTLPPTDALGSTQTTTGSSWGLVLLLMGTLSAGILFLTPARIVRKGRRD